MTAESGERHRTLEFAQERSVGAILSVFRRGGADPTMRTERGHGRWWVAWPTPGGPVTARLTQESGTRVGVRTWGSGGEWFLDQAPALLGELDDVSGFQPRHDLIAQVWRRFRHWRVPTSGLVVHALVPAVIEQRVTGQEAFAAQRRLVRTFGTPAPGPGRDLGLVVAPDARTWSAIPSWEWLQSSVDRPRSEAIMRALTSPGRLEECVGMSPEASRRRLRAIPGIGVWTAAEIAHRALGDADAVSFGDYHVAKNIGYALVGQEVDDAGLAELLEPYAGHRYRVQRLIEMAGIARPRRGARMAPRTHLPTRR